jgi:hypothetical protein
LNSKGGAVMPDITHCSSKNSATESIQNLIQDIEVNNEFEESVEALNSMITAINYNDDVLFESGLNKVFQAVASAVETGIAKRVNSVEKIRGSMPKFWDAIEHCSPESLQYIGEWIQSSYDEFSKKMIGLRDFLIKNLRDRGYEVRNANQLNWVIQELHSLKAEILKDWPWEDQSLPPVDREMVARSRTSKSGVRIEELIHSLESNADE